MRLLQTVPSMLDFPAKAVLEQPSSRWVAQSALGRRNIALLQSSELNRPQQLLLCYHGSRRVASAESGYASNFFNTWP